MSTLHDRTPFKAFFGYKPNLSHLHEIGARAFVLHNVPHNDKIGPRSFECILISYAGNSKAYCCYHCATHKVIESFHVCFIEFNDELPHLLFPGVVVSLPSPTDPPTTCNPPPLLPPSAPPCASPTPLHHSSHLHSIAPEPVTLKLDCVDPSARNPLSFAEACHSLDWPLWECALKEELTSIHTMNVYSLVPHDNVPVGPKFSKANPFFESNAMSTALQPASKLIGY